MRWPVATRPPPPGYYRVAQESCAARPTMSARRPGDARAVRVRPRPKDALRDTAEQPPPDAAPSMRAEDDEVYAPLFRMFPDPARRIARLVRIHMRFTERPSATSEAATSARYASASVTVRRCRSPCTLAGAPRSIRCTREMRVPVSFPAGGRTAMLPPRVRSHRGAPANAGRLQGSCATAKDGLEGLEQQIDVQHHDQRHQCGGDVGGQPAIDEEPIRCLRVV